jgi:hypothetical protein
MFRNGFDNSAGHKDAFIISQNQQQIEGLEPAGVRRDTGNIGTSRIDYGMMRHEPPTWSKHDDLPDQKIKALTC